MPIVEALPLEHYVGLLERNEPFCYLSYGDGEWLVATGMRTGSAMQAGEVVTPWLEQEIRASLDNPNPCILRGTDYWIVNWREYQGGDASSFVPLGHKIDALLEMRDIRFVDGVVWERACQDGKLGPFLKALQGREVYLVGNEKLYAGLGYHGAVEAYHYTWIPETNAVQYVAKILELVNSENSFPPDHALGATGKTPCYLLCCGLAAMPLALKIFELVPNAAVIDLGSSLDIFANLGEQRGWRAELYADKAKYRDLIRQNLEGVI